MRVYKVLSCAVLLAVVSCKSTQNTTIQSSSASKKTVTLSDAQQAELLNMFYNANKEKLIGNLTNASSLFAEVIRRDPSNAAAMYELAGIYLEQGKYADALFYSRSAWQIDPKNVWYGLQLSQAYQKNGKFVESANVLDQLVQANPNRVEFLFEQASAYLLANKFNEAIKTYDKIESIIGVTKDVSVQKQRLYQRQGKNDKAVAELQKLIAANPDDVQAYGMLAELYQSIGENQLAIETYNKVKEIDPENPFIHLSLADYYRNNGEKEKSIAELKQAFGNKNLDIETKITILSSYYSLNELHPELKEQSLEMCKMMIDAHPDDPRAHAVYGDFLSQDKQYEKSRTEFRKAQQLGSKEFSVIQQLLFLDSQLSDWDSLLIDSREALTNYPDQPSVYYFNGIALSQKKKYADAISVLQSGVKILVDNKTLEAQFLAAMGDAYYELKDYSNSDLCYEKALVANPKETYVMNNYSYYLSLRGQKLDKAEELSRRSNELQPDNASFQDTYGWILYKIGRYKEAKTWIEKSMTNGSEKSAVVLEHYGDVLYKLGENDKALEYWIKAKNAGDDGSEFLERKINEKKLFE